MTTRTETARVDPPIESRDDLLAVFVRGEKPQAGWRIGTEHEKFVYRRDDHGAPSYDEGGGIRDLLLEMTRFGWRPVEEGGKVIALSGDDGTISLEPAGQRDHLAVLVDRLPAELGHRHQQVANASRLVIGGGTMIVAAVDELLVLGADPP